MAFLQSIKSDREWAYRKISYYWDDSFIPLVKELWETYHEWQCALPIILHFPISYLQENIDSFSKGRRYFYLCKRFAESKTPFTIDKEKLNPEDLISIKQMMNEPITDAEALETFFFVIRSMFVDNLQGYHNGREKKRLLPVPSSLASTHAGRMRQSCARISQMGLCGIGPCTAKRRVLQAA